MVVSGNDVRRLLVRLALDLGLGFDFGYWGGGWFWHPIGFNWWYHSTPYTHRIFSEHWNPHWGTAKQAPFNQAWIRGNVDAYSHWAGNAVVSRNFEQRGTGQGAAGRPDLYAGRDGQVYQHRDDGWYQQGRSGNWQRMPSTPGLQQHLEQQRDSRTFGQSRQQEFQNRGQSPGIPRTVAPPRMPAPSAPSRPSGGSGRR